MDTSEKSDMKKAPSRTAKCLILLARPDGFAPPTYRFVDFNRSSFNNPCKGNFDCDLDVDGADLTKFIKDCNRSSFNNSCPQCVVGDWYY